MAKPVQTEVRFDLKADATKILFSVNDRKLRINTKGEFYISSKQSFQISTPFEHSSVGEETA